MARLVSSVGSIWVSWIVHSCRLRLVSELDRGAPRDDGDQGRRRHVQLPRSRVLRYPHEVRDTTSPLLLPFHHFLPRSIFTGQRRSVVCNSSPGNHQFLVEIPEVDINHCIINFVALIHGDCVMVLLQNFSFYDISFVRWDDS